jgi:hypothetical protein
MANNRDSKRLVHAGEKYSKTFLTWKLPLKFMIGVQAF